MASCVLTVQSVYCISNVVESLYCSGTIDERLDIKVANAPVRLGKKGEQYRDRSSYLLGKRIRVSYYCLADDGELVDAKFDGLAEIEAEEE